MPRSELHVHTNDSTWLEMSGRNIFVLYMFVAHYISSLIEVCQLFLCFCFEILCFFQCILYVSSLIYNDFESNLTTDTSVTMTPCI